MPDRDESTRPRLVRPLTPPFRGPAMPRHDTPPVGKSPRRPVTPPFVAPTAATVREDRTSTGASSQVLGSRPFPEVASPTVASDPLEAVSGAGLVDRPTLSDYAANHTDQSTTDLEASGWQISEQAGDDAGGPTAATAADLDLAENEREFETVSGVAAGHYQDSYKVDVEGDVGVASPAAASWPEDIWPSAGVDSAAGAGSTPSDSGATNEDSEHAASATAAEFVFGMAPAAVGAALDVKATAGTGGAETSSSPVHEAAEDARPSSEVAVGHASASESPTGAAEPAGGSLAEALELVARRVRSGELPASGYEAGMGDAAALAAALAAVLGVRR